MKHIIGPGIKIGKLTIIRRLPKRLGDDIYRWLCRCECGELVEKSRSVLTNKRVQHRCGECHSKAMKAYGRLLHIAAGTLSKPSCALGEHCRCAEGDTVGCWNWVQRGIHANKLPKLRFPTLDQPVDDPASGVQKAGIFAMR